MRTILILLTFLFLTTLLFGQTDEREDTVFKTVYQINQEKNYTVKKLKNEQWMEQTSDNGGELTGYFKNGQLVKIVEWVGLSHCTSIYTYYFQNNSLVFVSGEERVFGYDYSTGTFDINRQTAKMWCSYYFDKDRLIKSKFTGETRCGKQPTKADTTALLADSKKYIALLKK